MARREVKWGWCLSLSFFAYSCQLFSIYVRLGEAPLTNLELSEQAIRSAKKHLLLNVYDLSSTPITDAIIGRIQAGVRVEILQEGQPVGGIGTSAKALRTRILTAMKGSNVPHRYFEMTRVGSVKRRFRFDHAKYTVVDGQSLLIGSENYGPGGHPTPGTKGNRGWEVQILDEMLSGSFSHLFSKDVDKSFGDIVELTLVLDPLFLFTLPKLFAEEVERDAEENPIPLVNATGVKDILSPTTSLTGLLELFEGAKESIDVEEMSAPLYWDGGTKVSPIINKLIAKAREGKKIRVLLNNEKEAFGNKNEKNRETVNYINKISQEEKIPIEGRIADLKAMGVKLIHNKGVLVDRDKTLISSINWTENSVVNNREAGVIISGKEVNQFYLDLFDRDWKVSPPSVIIFN